MVASRLRDREWLLEMNVRAAEQSHYPDTLRWNPFAISHGDAGLAIACGYFDQCWPDAGWGDTASNFLRHALEALPFKSIEAGLISGLAGLAYAVRSIASGNPLRQESLRGIERTLASQVLAVTSNLYQHHGVAVSDFDAISGLAGIGAYILTSDTHPPLDVAWQALLEGLVALTETTNGVPHWFTPHHLLGDKSLAEAYPQGNMNCGLAHGIPGPLALLSLALLSGTHRDIGVQGLEEAVERTAAWLVAQQVQDQFGINWPAVVPLESPGYNQRSEMGTRAAWCYGAPGVARSLWLAGQAIEDSRLCDLAIDAMAAVYRRPIPMRQIDSPTFCHGVAGLLQITLRFAHDTGHALFLEAADALCRQLLSEFREDQPLGYCSLEPGGTKVDQSGLLDGSAGVAMVLLAAATGIEPHWDRVFLLS